MLGICPMSAFSSVGFKKKQRNREHNLIYQVYFLISLLCTSLRASLSMAKCIHNFSSCDPLLLFSPDLTINSFFQIYILCFVLSRLLFLPSFLMSSLCYQSSASFILIFKGICTNPFANIYYPSLHLYGYYRYCTHKFVLLQYAYFKCISLQSQDCCTKLSKTKCPTPLCNRLIYEAWSGPRTNEGRQPKSVCLKLEQWEVCRESVSIFPVSLQHGPLAAGRSLTFLVTMFRALLPQCQYEPIRPLVNTEHRR